MSVHRALGASNEDTDKMGGGTASGHERRGRALKANSSPGQFKAKRHAIQQKLICAMATLMGTLWAIATANYESPDPIHFGICLTGLALFVIISRNDRAASSFALVYACAVGLATRYNAQYSGSSDVLVATDEALQTLASGQNPYLHYFQHTIPAGSPFPYFPGELYYYAIGKALFGSVLVVDAVASCIIIAVLALFSRLIGAALAALMIMLYATNGLILARSADGSNDTSLALLLLSGVLALGFCERGMRSTFAGRRLTFLIAAGALLGWALAFKLTAILFVPALLLYAWKVIRPAWLLPGVAMGVAITMFLPLAATAPSAIWTQIFEGLFVVHPTAYGFSVWSAIRSARPDFVTSIQPYIPYVEGVVAALSSALLVHGPARSLGHAIGAGVLITLAVCFTSRFATSSYFALILTLGIPAVCLTFAPRLLRRS